MDWMMPMVCRSAVAKWAILLDASDEQTVGRAVSARSPQTPQLRIFAGLENPLSRHKAPVFPKDVSPYRPRRTEFSVGTGPKRPAATTFCWVSTGGVGVLW